MEIKVTIALDEKAHNVLNRLIDALSHKPNTTTIVTTVKDAGNSDGEWAEDEMREAMEQIAAEEAEAPAAEAEKTGVSPSKAKDGQVAEPTSVKANSPVSDDGNKPKGSKPKVTVEELRALAADVKVKQGSMDGVKALLNKYGAKNISSLPMDKLDAFAAELREML